MLACATVLLNVVAANVYAQTIHRYTVVPATDLKTLEVTACFDGIPPAYLTTTERRAHRYLRAPRVVGGTSLKIRGRQQISLHQLAPDTCVEYSVDLRNVRIQSRWSRERRSGRDRMMPFNVWLWRPQTLAADSDIELRFVRAGQINISAPWRLVRRSQDEVIYRLGHTPHDWNSTVVFGRFEVSELVFAQTRLRIVVVDATPPARVGEVKQWLRHAAASVTEIYGRFPLDSAQIIIVPIGSSEEAVPFGHVLRGGGSAVRFFIDQTRPLSQYTTDWTAIHELTHLAHPFFQDQDRWLAEGIASYYQSVLRARNTVLSQRRAWQKLYEGFQRGITATNRRRTLLQATEGGWSRGEIMRIYWSGAAIALLADVELRERSGGLQSLDTALGAFQSCCLPSERLWTAQEFLGRLDELTATSVFSELYRAHANSRQFPEFSEAFQRLGITVVDGKVHLLESAPLREQRDAIMTPGEHWDSNRELLN